jgi:hypothetical protein
MWLLILLQYSDVRMYCLCITIYITGAPLLTFDRAASVDGCYNYGEHNEGHCQDMTSAYASPLQEDPSGLEIKSIRFNLNESVNGYV